MKTRIFLLTVALMAFAGSLTASGSGHESAGRLDSLQANKVYYAIEINEVLCGYFEADENRVQKEGKEYIQADVNIFTMLSLLGSQFNSEIRQKSLLDPSTRKEIYSHVEISQASNKHVFEMKVEADTALLSSSLRSGSKRIGLGPEVLVGNDHVLVRARKEFIENNASEAEFDILETLEQEIQRSTFRKLGTERIELVGRTFDAVIIEQTNNKTSVKTKYWLAPDYPDLLKFEVQNRKIYLADRSVIDRIKVANMDAAFFTKSNVSISDLQAISYMKLNAKIAPTGIILKAEDLNSRGQKFSGKVENNLIEGIFEIEEQRYDGKVAPPFPPPFDGQEPLKKYLTPEQFIESGDPVLAEKAKEITSGSKDSWEAAVKLSKWVAENISYAIPGGGTAQKTYEIRAGECGAHSMLLTAFCRAVGIPARVVFGAMYAPNFGGGFGQHAWNEIYMGDAGWIGVDATAHETDYVDAGHIRISELGSVVSAKFNGEKIEILDYKLREKPKGSTVKDENEYASYLGKYVNVESGRTFTVLEKEGNLSVDIPGQMVLPFNPEDGKGRWHCKIAPQINIAFINDSEGSVNGMIFHQMVTLTKKSTPHKIEESVPKEFIPYLGNYFLAAANADFTVLVANGSLAVYDPTKKDTVELHRPDAGGGWLDEYDKNTIFFPRDEKGNVTGMKIDAAMNFKRGELASDIIEKVLDSEGLETTLRRYDTLKNSNSDKVIFTERSFNLLGYKYLNSQKIKEAIGLFRLNARAYPESFNVYDSLGEAYMKNGENGLAIENYRKSLELNPKNENAQEKLKTLEEK